MPLDPHPRFSLNQKTTERWSAREAILGCHGAGVESIGLWREHVAAEGIQETAELLRTTGIQVSSLCRGGFFPSATGQDFADAVEENKTTIDEAAALDCGTVVIVPGGIAGRDLDRSRRQVAEGIEAVLEHAQRRGVRLAVEPLHPVLCADKSVIVTLAQALALAEEFPSDSVGVVVDTYHLWWDPEVWNSIARAGSRIFSYQICDWLDPLPDPVFGRGMMGDGVIDFTRFTNAVTTAGYGGPIEVEIFNKEIWDQPRNEVLMTAISRFSELIEPHLVDASYRPTGSG